MKTITYYYRGLIERNRRIGFVEGYSAVGENGGILYPWMTVTECRKDAKSQKAKAIFVRPGEPPTSGK